MKVEDRKRIKTYEKRPHWWSCIGGMDIWMGKNVTIKYIMNSENIHIKEDNSKWWWSESDFEDIIEMDMFKTKDFEI